MGSAGIAYLHPVQRTYPSTTKFSPVFVCVRIYVSEVFLSFRVTVA